MKRALELAIVAAVWVSAMPAAQAEGFRLNLHRTPALASDGLSLARPTTLEASQWSAGVRLDYANDPLVLELERGDRETEYSHIVSNQLQGHVAFAFGVVDRLSMFGIVNVVLLMDGEATPMPGTPRRATLADGAGLGDARVGGRVRFLGDTRGGSGLAAEAALIVPLAEFADEDQNFRGENGFAGDVTLLGDVDLSVLRLGGAVGVRLRDTLEFIDTELGHELLFGLGASVPFANANVEAIVEAQMSTALADAFAVSGTPVELLAGVRANALQNWRFMVGAGPGIQRGVGSPDFRMLAGVSYVSTTTQQPIGEPNEDLVPMDSDGDGVPDNTDSCIDSAEDKDNHQDEDGCADPDNDGDGVMDASDRCPNEVEDQDGNRDDDGCPDADNDGDGLDDTSDACPNEAEDRDGVQDSDGCPDGDSDQDGIDDVLDKCPNVPGDAANEGCSKAVALDQGQIRIQERIEFQAGRADLLPSSEAILRAVNKVLEVNPNLDQIMVQGHTDGRGSAKTNLDLSKRRAATVVAWLKQQGIPAERLTAWGCGEARPIATEETPAGRQQNRRVEFHVIDTKPGKTPDTQGCESAE